MIILFHTSIELLVVKRYMDILMELAPILRFSQIFFLWPISIDFTNRHVDVSIIRIIFGFILVLLISIAQFGFIGVLSDYDSSILMNFTNIIENIFNIQGLLVSYSAFLWKSRDICSLLNKLISLPGQIKISTKNWITIFRICYIYIIFNITLVVVIIILDLSYKLKVDNSICCEFWNILDYFLFGFNEIILFHSCYTFTILLGILQKLMSNINEALSNPIGLQIVRYLSRKHFLLCKLIDQLNDIFSLIFLHVLTCGFIVITTSLFGLIMEVANQSLFTIIIYAAWLSFYLLKTFLIILTCGSVLKTVS